MSQPRADGAQPETGAAPVCLFQRRDQTFWPTDHAAGPWSPDTLHGGPVAGLLTHALIREPLPEGFHVARLHFDLLRPAPRQALNTEVETIRNGRRLQLREARLLSAGRLLARGSLTGLAERTLDQIEDARRGPAEMAMPDEFPPGHLGFAGEAQARSEPSGFSQLTELRRVSGAEGRGEGAGWFRMPAALVDGEPLSPLERLASCSDFANGLSQNLLDGLGFINVDIDLRLFRDPIGEWIGIDSRCRVFPEGAGWVFARVFDTSGRIGTIQQSVMATDRAWG